MFFRYIAKKFIVLFVLSVWLNIGISQPNSGFEDWVTEFTYETPEHWQTFNFLSLASNPLSAFKATGLDVHSGNYALKLKSIYLNNNVLPDTFKVGDLAIGDTIGGTFIGKIHLSPVSFIYGFPYANRPSKLQFWAKYNPVGNDTAGAMVVLKGWSNGLDTIGYGELKINSTPGYTLFEVPIEYYNENIPDSATVIFLPSRTMTSARQNSTLFVDDVALTGSVGLEETKHREPKVRVFPNPAREKITVSTTFHEAASVRIKDISGKELLFSPINDRGATFNISTLAPGMYFYEISDKKDNVLKCGRFNVTK